MVDSDATNKLNIIPLFVWIWTYLTMVWLWRQCGHTVTFAIVVTMLLFQIYHSCRHYLNAELWYRLFYTDVCNILEVLHYNFTSVQLYDNVLWRYICISVHKKYTMFLNKEITLDKHFEVMWNVQLKSIFGCVF